MAAMAGVYYLLSRGEFDKETGKLHHPEKIAAPAVDNATEADPKLRLFSGERRIFNILNEMEPGLGERFEAAIQANPPQKTAWKPEKAAHSR
jgi:hypothetical protein